MIVRAHVPSIVIDRAFRNQAGLSLLSGLPRALSGFPDSADEHVSTPCCPEADVLTWPVLTRSAAWLLRCG